MDFDLDGIEWFHPVKGGMWHATDPTDPWKAVCRMNIVSSDVRGHYTNDPRRKVCTRCQDRVASMKYRGIVL